MGMFDWYLPKGDPPCPVCGRPLREWQGKDGPCGLFVWKEGSAAPADQRVDPECRLVPEELAKVRLPRRFFFYCYDCPAHIVEAEGHAPDGVWTSTVLLPVKGL